MKRHPSLRDLSVDHHHGLVHARRLLNAGVAHDPGEPGEPRELPEGSAEEVRVESIVQSFLRFFETEANRHFREEEEVLLPAYARHGDPSAEPVVRVLVEHIELRRLVADLRRQLRSGNLSLDTAHSAGALLQSHIRYEENVLFPLIEKAMPDDALDDLSKELSGFGGV